MIVPVLNDAARLQRCLTSIRENSYPATLTETIVADNGSTDDSPAVARRMAATVICLPGLKVAKLRNAAAASTSSSILAFIDADHEIDPEWLARAAEVLADGSIAACGAAYSAPPSANWVQRHYNALRGVTRGRRDTAWLASGNMAVRRTAFDAVGGFDEALETCEDVDLCQRLLANGGRLVADERLKSVHFGDPNTLAAILRGELWRGRDNLRVSFRARMTLRDAPSVIIPLLDVGFLLLIGAGVVMPPRARVLVGIGVLGFTAAALVRTASILARLPGLTAIDLGRAFAVAAMYDLGRALALVIPASHTVRRRRATA